MKKFLITGTDTGAGKTLVTSLILRGLLERGEKVGTLKPVETGCEEEEGELVAKDVQWLRKALKESVDEESLIIKKYRSPVAPLVAARFEEDNISWEELVKETSKRANKQDYFLIEGAGGLLVPICEGKTYADLAKELDLSVILVFGSKLGAINHGALTLEVLRSRGIKVKGYIFNQLEEESESEVELASTSNRELFKEVAAAYEVKELGVIPYLLSEPKLDEFDGIYSNLDLKDLIGNIIDE